MNPLCTLYKLQHCDTVHVKYVNIQQSAHRTCEQRKVGFEKKTRRQTFVIVNDETNKSQCSVIIKSDQHNKIIIS